MSASCRSISKLLLWKLASTSKISLPWSLDSPSLNCIGATSRSHTRSTYRNFFPANAQWQFMGIRLAKGV